MATPQPGMALASITISLVATEDNTLQVQTGVEGVLQYVTAMGMLAMAQQNIQDLYKEAGQ